MERNLATYKPKQFQYFNREPLVRGFKQHFSKNRDAKKRLYMSKEQMESGTCLRKSFRYSINHYKRGDTFMVMYKETKESSGKYFVITKKVIINENVVKLWFKPFEKFEKKELF